MNRFSRRIAQGMAATAVTGGLLAGMTGMAGGFSPVGAVGGHADHDHDQL